MNFKTEQVLTLFFHNTIESKFQRISITSLELTRYIPPYTSQELGVVDLLFGRPRPQRDFGKQ